MSYPDMYFTEIKKKPLSQGDIFLRFEDKVIPKSEEVEELAFIILTYTCDLEHSEDLNYLLYCPIFDFDIVIKKYIKKLEDKTLININSAIKDIVKDLFNNDKRYYFFLSPIPKVSNNPSYAHLEQITKIPKDYMNEIVKNRKASLNKPWREKLGWMTGNLFNRIALVDIDKKLPNQYIQKSDSFKTFIEMRCNQIKNSLIEYFRSDNDKTDLLKDVVLPIFLSNEKTTRDMIKAKLNQNYTENEVKSILEIITSEINGRDNDFLRDLITFEKKHHKLENFRINILFKSIIKEVLNSLSN